MKWPTHSDYQDAIQSPAVCFAEPELKGGEITLDMLGLPRVMSGNFASVYELRTGEGHYAIRCFVRQVPGQQGRYARLSQYLSTVSLEWIVKFEYILKGILVHGEWYPIVRMEWVQGLQLNSYVEEHIQEPDVLRRLASKWRILVNQLRDARIAHADFQHGNVMVTPSHELRLVDYDGMYCPAFGRNRAPELGHPSFQHPRRTPDYYEERLDNFAAIVVFLSLVALAREPELWEKFYTGDNLILGATDYRNTQQSAAFARLKESPDPIVSQLAALVQECCIAPIECTPWFEDAIQAVEKNSMQNLIASVKAAAESAAAVGAAPETRPHEPAAAPQPAAEQGRGTRPAVTQPAQAPAAPVPAPATPTPVATPTPQAKARKAWLPIAAALVVLAGLGGYFLFGGKKAPPAPPPKPSPQVTTPQPSPAPPPAAKTTQPGTPAAAQAKPPGVIAGAIKVTELKSLIADGPVSWLDFTPNGRFVVTGVEDGTVKLWEPASGQAKQTLPGQGDGVHSVVFLPDGKTVLTVSSDNVIRYWDLGAAKETKTVSDHTKNLWAVAVSPDGQYLATGASDRKIVRLLDPQAGAQKRLLSQHSSWVRAVGFSPDSKLAAVSCWDDSVKIWVAASGEARAAMTVLSNTVEGVVFSYDGKLLASAGMGRTVKLWDTQTGAVKQTLMGHTGDVRCFAFSRNDRLVAAGSNDKTVRIWDTATGQMRQTFTGHEEAVTAVAFSSDGSLLASGGGSKTVKLWDISKLNP